MFNLRQTKNLIFSLLFVLELSWPLLPVPPLFWRDGPIHTGALSQLHDRADHSSAYVAARQNLSGGMNCLVWSESMWKSWPP